MKVLIACYSRSGNTACLADRLAGRLKDLGHEVVVERIHASTEKSKWQLVPPLLSTLPVLPLFLFWPRFRRWWFGRYRQAEQQILPLEHPDVSGFDRICLGAPKWLYLAYPLARYLNQVKGLQGKQVGAFATFCGPPLAVFELEMLFEPIRQRVQSRGGRVVANLAISSQHHEFFFFHEMEYIFRLISWFRFWRPLHAFTLDSKWGKAEIERYCDAVMSDSP